MSVTADTLGAVFLEDTLATFRKQKELAERAIAQVSDDDFFRILDAESNSIAIIVKHVGGNLRSRWTDFLTSDGEKPTRDRDGEFVVTSETSRSTIMSVWDAGWKALFDAFATLSPSDLMAVVVIRQESMTAIAAMHRALAHIAQHIGQIVMLAKHYRSTDWKTLSIPRGHSADWHTTPSPTAR
jgi:hypothetical protein